MLPMNIIYTWLFPTVWALWCLYWLIAARGVKPVQRTESVDSRLTHYLPLALAILLLAWPEFGGPLLSRHILPPSAGLFWIGAVLLFTGLLFSVAARLRLGGNWSGTVTVKQDHSLIRSGPYRLVRHPIYTGMLLAIAGNAVARGEWRDVLAFALIAAAFWLKIRIEERFMLAQFGEAYARYQKEVPALVPGLL
jgi:protein-S-isoprenylcysteine O-methyltransferase Ste14